MENHLDQQLSPEQVVYAEIAGLIDSLPSNQQLPLLAAAVADRIGRAGPEDAYTLLGLVTSDVVRLLKVRLDAFRQTAN
jgi:hypothetical protein